MFSFTSRLQPRFGLSQEGLFFEVFQQKEKKRNKKTKTELEICIPDRFLPLLIFFVYPNLAKAKKKMNTYFCGKTVSFCQNFTKMKIRLFSFFCSKDGRSFLVRFYCFLEAPIEKKGFHFSDYFYLNDKNLKVYIL